MHEISWPINKFCDFIPTSNWHISCHNQLMKFATFSMTDWQILRFSFQWPIDKIYYFFKWPIDQIYSSATDNEILDYFLLRPIAKIFKIFFMGNRQSFKFFYMVLVNFPLLICLFILIYLLIYFILSPFILFLAIPIYLNIKLAFYLFTC